MVDLIIYGDNPKKYDLNPSIGDHNEHQYESLIRNHGIPFPDENRRNLRFYDHPGLIEMGEHKSDFIGCHLCYYYCYRAK